MKSQLTKFQSQKADLLLINQISKPSKISKFQAPSNMQELHNILKFKNNKLNRSKQQIQNAQNWLNTEGISISPLIEKVKKAKEVTIQRQQLRKIEEDCFFYISDMSHKKIDQYLNKAHQYATMNIVQKNMKKSGISTKILQRSKLKIQENNFSGQISIQKTLGVITSIKTQTRNQEKRQKYLKCISQMSNKNFQRSQLANQLSRRINAKFWKVIASHANCLNEMKIFNDNEKMTYLCLDSLKQVQNQFDSLLPRQTQNLNNYLKRNYLQKIQKKDQSYLRDREHLSFWGKAYLLYRAGRRKDFYNLLSTRNEIELMSIFKKIDLSIDKKQPLTGIVEETSPKDVFKDQLYFSIKGQSKYSSLVISDPNTLDCIWILLRNIGIFYGKTKDQFSDCKKKLISAYENEGNLSEQQIYNLFYLVAYDEIVRLGISSIMDQDDYVHFLICLSQNQKLRDSKSTKFSQIFTKQLISYINQLIHLGKNQYVYYLSLIPRQNRIAQISQILSSSNLVTTTNWQFLKNNLSSTEQFTKIVQRTLQKYILITSDYLSSAQKYIELLNDQKQAIKCLLGFLIKNFVNDNGSNQIVSQAEAACDRYLYKNSQLQTIYRDILNFLIECRKIPQLCRQRKSGEIYHLVKNSSFILLSSFVPARNQALYDNLIQLSGMGLDAYFKYLKYIVKGIEIYYLQNKNPYELAEFKRRLQENIDYLLSIEKYSIYRSRDETNSFLEAINSQLYQSYK